MRKDENHLNDFTFPLVTFETIECTPKSFKHCVIIMIGSNHQSCGYVMEKLKIARPFYPSEDGSIQLTKTHCECIAFHRLKMKR